MEEPTIDMWRALLAFRKRYGRTWKRILVCQWMSGGDERQPYSASLRAVRNQLGPSWLYRQRPAQFDDQARRIARFDRLPIMCATLHPDNGLPIVLKRGEPGYWPLPQGISIEAFNKASQPTPAQIAAMLIGSAFGWDVPGADPENYDMDGRPSVSRRAHGASGGGEGAE